MRFSIQGHVFMEMLTLAAKVVVSKPVIPIFDCVRFDVGRDDLRLTASDNAVTATVCRPLSSPAEGEALPFCVPLKDLSGALRGLSSELRFDTDCESRLTVTWSDGELRLPALTTVDWPEEPEPERRANVAKMNLSQLLPMLPVLECAVAKDELRPALCGIHLEFLGNRLEAVSTDAHRLAIAGIPDTSSKRAFSLTVPAKAAGVLKRMFTGSVKVCADKQRAMFSSKEDRLVCRLLEDAFPNYRSIIPARHGTAATFHRETLVAAGSRLRTCTSPAQVLRLSLTDVESVLFAEDIGRQVMGEERVPCDLDGEGMDIGFNATYFFEVMDNLPGDRITFFVSDPAKVALIRPEEYDESKENIQVLLTPVMLNKE